LITKQTWLSTKLEHAGVQQDIDGFRNEIRQLGVHRLDNTKQTETELTALAIQIDETQRLLGRQMRAGNEASLVKSPYNGRVIEVRSSEGVLVKEGTPLLAIEQTGNAITDLEARIYVAPMDGKKVKPNMEVQVAPSSVKSEEFGYLLGKVRTVADFPSTAQGMMRILNNEDLVKQLAAGAAPISVQADLIPNAATVSGYRWSSPKGPDSRIESGTLCSASIIVKRQRPIALVLPFLREYLGL
jgi:HlyD family secretion protein